MAGARILLVDDLDAWRDVLAGALETFDEVDEVRTASTYLTAVEIVADFAPDVVVTDFRLGPGVRDGLAVCRAVRETRPTAKLIVLTGHATLTAAREAIAVGAAFFDKATFQIDDLRVALSPDSPSSVRHSEH